MAPPGDPKRFARDWIDDNRDRLAAFEQAIWDHAEPAWREWSMPRPHADAGMGEPLGESD